MDNSKYDALFLYPGLVQSTTSKKTTQYKVEKKPSGFCNSPIKLKKKRARNRKPALIMNKYRTTLY